MLSGREVDFRAEDGADHAARLSGRMSRCRDRTPCATRRARMVWQSTHSQVISPVHGHAKANPSCPRGSLVSCCGNVTTDRHAACVPVVFKLVLLGGLREVADEVVQRVGPLVGERAFYGAESPVDVGDALLGHRLVA